MGGRIGSITFGGLSSGFQTEELVDGLLSLERRPIEQLQARRDQFGVRADLFRDLNARTLSLRSLLRSIDNRNLVGTDASADEEFTRYTATSSDSSIATATVDGSASPGTLNVRVEQLAAASRYVSDESFADTTDAVGTGTFEIFVDGSSTGSITIDSSNNTVEEFVDAINEADAGVSAFLLNDGDASNPYRIVIQGDDTGADFAVTFDNQLSGDLLNFDAGPSQAAQDAIVYLDPDGTMGGGVEISRSTNTIDDIVEGVTLRLSSANEDGVYTDFISVQIESDEDATVSAIQEVVDAYNSIMELINEQSELDPTTGRGGPLIGDGTLASLQRQLSTVLASEVESGSITTPGEIGLSLDTEGVLTLDSDALRSALASDPDGVREFFSGSGSLSDQLRDVADAFVDPVDGLLVARIEGSNQSVTDLEGQIERAEDRLEIVEQSLVRQFAAMERILSGIQLQGNFIAQFLLQNQQT